MLPAVLAALAGLSFGASAFLSFGFYDLSSWGPLALVWLAVLLALAASRPALPRGSALAAVGGLALLFAWTLISTRWAEAAEQALIDADRWLLYLVVLAALLLLLRGPRLERVLLAAIALPLLGHALYLVVEMTLGDARSLFLTNRLHGPAEYVNATAAFLLIGFWPAIAVAERARSAALAGAGLAAAVLFAGLAVMTQSRGGIAALLLSAVVVLAVVPGRVRRGWALVVAAAGLGACSPALSDVVAGLPAGTPAPDEGTIESAAIAVVLAALGAGLVWLAVTAAGPRIEARWDARRARMMSAGALVAVALAGLVAVSVPPGERFDSLGDQYEDFTELREIDADASRFASGGGNRYDYWQIAFDQFEDDPVVGQGAGDYESGYYRERRTTENIRQPHSIELQTLAEAGLVGGAALALFLGGGLMAFWQRAHPGSRREPEPGLAVAAGGAFIYWLLHTSVDWLHLIPGLTGIALCALAVLLAPHLRAVAWPTGTPRRAAALAGMGLAAAAAVVLVASPLLGQELRDDGYDALADDPGQALDDARDSLGFDDEALSTYYLESAALARMNDYAGAEQALLEATRREPDDHVTWALLGDLAVRGGDLEAARRHYGKASRLNPRDAGLKALAANPQARP